MMAYHAPGNIDELSPAVLDQWNRTLSDLMQSQIGIAQRLLNPDAPRAWLFDPIADGVEGVIEKTIDWIAFPKRVSNSGLPPAQGWDSVDNNRDLHEEYCEWEVARNPEGKVVRVTFTCETEDYYNFLFDHDQALLLQLYHQHVSPNVQLAQLTRAGRYDPQNVWNYPQLGGARGLIMHMAQRNNSFGAAVNLSAIASWPRVDDNGQPIIGEQALIECAPFGAAERHSDPHIGAEINALVRAGNEISFADPVGLYIDRVDLSDFDVPDGVAATDLMRIVRGTPEFMLRIIFEAPAESGFTLSDVRVGDERIRFGSQIAEKIQVRIRGIARPADTAAPVVRCDNQVRRQLIAATDLPADPTAAASPSRTVARMSALSPE